MVLTQLFYDEGLHNFRMDSPLGKIVQVEAIGKPYIDKFDTLENIANRLGAKAYCKDESQQIKDKNYAIYQLYKFININENKSY